MQVVQISLNPEGLLKKIISCSKVIAIFLDGEDFAYLKLLWKGCAPSARTADLFVVLTLSLNFNV